MLTTVPQQDAGNLNQPQVVGGLLLVAYQDGAALRQPAQRALYYPSSSRITLLSLQVLLLFSNASDMRLVVVALHHFPSGLCLFVALVQTQMLRSLLGGFGTLHHDGIERGFEQLEVGYIRSGYHHRHSSSVGLEEKGALHPILPSISGIGAYLVPQNEPCPSRRPRPATGLPLEVHPTEFLAVLDETLPDEIQHAKLDPPLEGPVYRGVVGKLSSGQSVPLAAASHPNSHPKNDRVQSGTLVHARAAGALFGGSCSFRIGSMISHNSSGTRQMVGSDFFWAEFSDIAQASFGRDHRR